MRLWRSLVTWFGAMLYGIPWGIPQVEEFQGATLGWSPRATVAAVDSVAAWDVSGWMDRGQRQLHKRLDGVEARLHSRLDRLLAEVYEWRDAA